MRAKEAAVPLATYDADLKAILAKAVAAGSGKETPVPSAVGPLKAANGEELPVTELAPEPRARVVASEDTSTPAASPRTRRPHVSSHVRSVRFKRSRHPTSNGVSG
jgi:hypothetical protein